MRELLFKLIGALILAASLFGGWQLMRYQAFVQGTLEVGPEGAVVAVRPGMSLRSVAGSLEREGLISDAQLFIWMARLKGAAQNIRAGEYRVESGMGPPALLDRMVSGQVVQHALTVVEGWTFRQMLDAMHKSPHLDHTLAGLGDSEIMARLGRAHEHPEGRFFPDTYHFPRGMTDLEFLKRAYRSMSERLEAEWANRKEGLPLKGPYEALILASIVEKETGVPEERPEIAGVFVRRLLKGMRLQTDPTVIYGLGEAFDGNLRRRDLRAENPYNTYRIKGLPPTPIAMPGGDAIHAVLHPKDGKALYFVARGDGSHQFSATLTEHNAAVVRYQLKGRARPFSSYPGE